MREHACVRVLVPVVVLLASLARGAAAAGVDLLRLARKYKGTAVEKLKTSPGTPDEPEVTKALSLLKTARKLLLKHEQPLPQTVMDELAEVNALLYWARGTLPGEAAATVELPPLLNPNGKGRDALAREYLERARACAAKNPDDRFMIVVRYAEVAGRFEGTEASRQARGPAAKRERVAPGGPGERPAPAELPPPDPARGRDALRRLLAEIDSLIGKGDYGAALSRVETAAADAALDDFADVIVAAHGVCESLSGRRRAIRRVVQDHQGKEIELRTSKGKLLGKVQTVTDEDIDLLLRKKLRGMGTIETRMRLKWSDLTPEQEDELAREGGWKAEGGAAGAVVRAYVALARKDTQAAGRAIAEAGDHPLAARIRRRIDAPRYEAAERAARSAWQEIERAAGAAKTSAVEVRRLVARIDAFEKRYRDSEFAMSVRDKAGAMKRRARWSLLPRRGLVAHWPLDESEGATARDVSGNGHHGTLRGSPAWQPDGGRVDGALRFGGRGQYVDCGTVPGSAAALTLAFWMKADSVTDQIPVDKHPADKTGVGWTIKLKWGDQLRFRIGSTGNYSDLKVGSAYAAGAWVHVACTFQTGEARVYCDGMAKGSQTGIRITVGNTTTSLHMGRPSVAYGREAFAGLLDDVRIYDRALSAAEVAALYRAGASGPAPKVPVPEPSLLGPKPDAARGRITGLLGTYYSGSDFDSAVLRRIDPQVDFDWGKRSPHPRVSADNFSVRWEGFILAPATGRYAFHVDSDDGFRMRLSGKWIVDKWGPNRVVAKESARIALVRGRFYPVRIEYMDARGFANVHLRWTGPGTREPVPVPAQLLRPPPGHEKLPGPPLVK